MVKNKPEEEEEEQQQQEQEQESQDFFRKTVLAPQNHAQLRTHDTSRNTQTRNTISRFGGES